MAVTRLTIKGQVTIPRLVRSALGLKPGDGVVFVLEGDRAVLVPIKRRSLTELHGCLPVSKPFPGTEEVRRVIHERIAEHVVGISDNDSKQ
jgi:antitoxin PrlF